ncbi:MAG: hypothetical protein ACR2GB_08355, partial [Nocardioidaceae bacterium]
LSRCVERARYAASLPTGAQPSQDAQQVMAVLSRNADRGRRIRAVLLPASLMGELRQLISSVRDRRAQPGPVTH